MMQDPNAAAAIAALLKRVETLEHRVADLQEDCAALRAELGKGERQS